MGFCGGAADVDENDEILQKRNRAVNKAIDAATRASEEMIHLLLLGAGESGKSTVFKQMKVLNQGGYTKEELKAFRPIVHRNVLDGIQILLRECEARDLVLHESNEERGDRLLLWQGENLNPQLGEDVATLWQDPAVQACFSLRDDFQFPTAANYFLDNVSRVAANDYLPDVKDVVSRPAARCPGAEPLSSVPP